MRALKLGAVALLATGFGVVAAGSSSAITNTPAISAVTARVAFASRVTPTGLASSGRLFGGASGDASGTRVVTYGGQVPNSNTSHADTWVNGADGTWKATCGNAAAHAPAPCGPGPRSGLGLANTSGGVVLFGGFTTSIGQAPAGDTWHWNGSTWNRLCTTAACGPGARGLVAMAGNGDTAVMFGGLGTSGITNDTWVFDGTTWTQACGQSGAPCGPPPLGGAAMAWDGKHFVLFGGDDLNGGPPVDDTWIFSVDHWIKKCGTSIAKPCGPPARALAAFAYAGASQTGAPGAIVAGGGDIFSSGTQHLYRDAWFFDGTRWTRLDPPWNGPARTFPENGSPPAGPDPLVGVMAAKPALCEAVYLGTKVRHAGNPPALGQTTFAFGRAPWTAAKPDCKASVSPTTLATTTTSGVGEPGLIADPPTTFPTLPRTGATAPGASSALGVVLIGFGALLLAAVRKRKRD